LGNVVTIGIFEQRNARRISMKQYAAIYCETISVHRESNAEKVIEMLTLGKPIDEVKEMICPNCMELTGRKCKCMEGT